jgi:hypothetical protein
MSQNQVDHGIAACTWLSSTRSTSTAVQEHKGLSRKICFALFLLRKIIWSLPTQSNWPFTFHFLHRHLHFLSILSHLLAISWLLDIQEKPSVALTRSLYPLQMGALDPGLLYASAQIMVWIMRHLTLCTKLAAAFAVEAIVWGFPDAFGVFLNCRNLFLGLSIWSEQYLITAYLQDPRYASQKSATSLLPLIGTLSSGIIYCSGICLSYIIGVFTG